MPMYVYGVGHLLISDASELMAIIPTGSWWREVSKCDQNGKLSSK